MAHGGQELGHALAAVLFGDQAPGGRLVQTWPRSLDQLPPMLDYDIRRGRTHQYFTAQPLYPFGYGLSYTQFEYRKLSVDTPELHSRGEVRLEVELANVGPCAGDEVVQVYARHQSSGVDRPRQRLVAFQRVHLRRGDVTTVLLAIPAREFEHYSEASAGWELEPGPVELSVRRSADDTVLSQSIEVKAA
jgi:beta-glucosidase